MERKIGEIFEFGGEWYQCVGGTCRNCSFYYDTVCKNIITIGSTNFGNCHCSLRTDHKSVIFKKLEKVGEPVTVKGRTFQKLTSDNNSCKECVFNVPNKACCKNSYIEGICDDNGFWVEIKQTKEDMEESGNNRTNCAQCGDKRFEVIARAKAHLLEATNIASDEKEMAVIDNILFRFYQMGWLERYEEETQKLDLKPFSLEAAKQGKPVCTRDGRKARIICFDRCSNKSIVALVTTDDREYLTEYYCDGRISHNSVENNDLMMYPEKKEGWVNVMEGTAGKVYVGNDIYRTEDEAKEGAPRFISRLIASIPIEWEE